MVNATVKDGQHHTVAKGGKEQQKQRKLEANQDIALVGLKRMIEKNKTDKIQSNLHLLDFPKTNEHIYFVSDPTQAKTQPLQVSTLPPRPAFDDDDFEDVESVEADEAKEKLTATQKYKNEKERYLQQIKRNLSDNKSQYKKLADSIVKEQQYAKVEQALILEKNMKAKGKKRKVEDQATGKTFFKWFSERKR